jgi:hypothetical protein
MQVVVEIISVDNVSRQIRLEVGQTVRVGRASHADFALPLDTYLSGVHFSLECLPDACILRDLKSSNGTIVNNKQVSETTLSDGDEIVAGHTTFVIHIEADAPAASAVEKAAIESTRAQTQSPTLAPAVAPPFVQSLLEILRRQPEPLFVLLDAARDRRVLQLLRSSEAEYQSLYEGEKGKELEEYAPYLVSLPPQSDFLGTLINEGWGKSWGLFLTSDRPFAKVRRYLRQFLLVKDEDGRELYFRFYDPRVMRQFLPTCEMAEAARLFGPISRYLVEAAEPEMLLQFVNGERGALEKRFHLALTESFTDPFPTAPEGASSK